MASSVDAALDLATALRALRGGALTRAVVSGGSSTANLLALESRRGSATEVLAELRGFYVADDSPPNENHDDLEPARALRRALADGHLHASDVGYACALDLNASDQGRGLTALERGLGRFAAAASLDTGQDPLVRAAKACAGLDLSVGASVGLIIRRGGGSIALAFGRP